jgi:hypothetical protein
MAPIIDATDSSEEETLELVCVRLASLKAGVEYLTDEVVGVCERNEKLESKVKLIEHGWQTELDTRRQLNAEIAFRDQHLQQNLEQMYATLERQTGGLQMFQLELHHLKQIQSLTSGKSDGTETTKQSSEPDPMFRQEVAAALWQRRAEEEKLAKEVGAALSQVSQEAMSRCARLEAENVALVRYITALEKRMERQEALQQRPLARIQVCLSQPSPAPSVSLPPPPPAHTPDPISVAAEVARMVRNELQAFRSQTSAPAQPPGKPIGKIISREPTDGFPVTPQFSTPPFRLPTCRPLYHLPHHRASKCVQSVPHHQQSQLPQQHRCP